MNNIMIIIESKRKKIENILKKYSEAVIADVTSKAQDGLVKMSPFYPHGYIPVSFDVALRSGYKVLYLISNSTLYFSNFAIVKI